MSARPPSLVGTTAVLRKPAHSSQSPAPALYPSAMLPGCLAAWLETRGCPVLASGGLPDAGFNDDTDTMLSTPVKSVQPALPRVRWSAEPTGNRQPATATLSTGWHCLRTIASSVEPLRGRLTKLRPDGAVRSFACSYALINALRMRWMSHAQDDLQCVGSRRWGSTSACGVCFNICRFPHRNQV